MAPADAPAPRQPDTPTPRHPDKAWLRSWEAGRLRGWEATFHKASTYLKSLVVVSKLQLWFFLLTPKANSGPLPPLLNTFPTQGYNETPLAGSTKIMVSRFLTQQKNDKTKKTLSRQISSRTIHRIYDFPTFCFLTCLMIRLSLPKGSKNKQQNKQSKQGQ